MSCIYEDGIENRITNYGISKKTGTKYFGEVPFRKTICAECLKDPKKVEIFHLLTGLEQITEDKVEKNEAKKIVKMYKQLKRQDKEMEEIFDILSHKKKNGIL